MTPVSATDPEVTYTLTTIVAHETVKPIMKKAVFFAILGLVLIVLILGGGKALQIRDLISAGASMQPPPTTVSSEIAQRAEWEQTLRAVGATEAAQGVLITADIAGRIAAINFEAGQEVEAGAILIEQEVSSELTQLQAAEADESLARSNLDRVNRLFQQKLISRAEYDSARAAFQSASARTETVRASLDKKQIVAPFSGRLGLRQVDLGQSITAGTPIVSLQAADPMLINFSLPQYNMQFLSAGLGVRVTSDAVPDTVFEGRITAINTEIDPATRTVSIQATLANPNGLILPGMFASVDVILPETEPVVMIPVTAVSYASFGDSVFVIEPAPTDDNDASDDASNDASDDAETANTEAADADSNETNTTETTEGDAQALIARQQFVQLGESRGDYVAVTAGLKEGERVASAGVFKLRNGASVALNEDTKPEISLTPVVDNK